MRRQNHDTDKRMHSRPVRRDRSSDLGLGSYPDVFPVHFDADTSTHFVLVLVHATRRHMNRWTKQSFDVKACCQSFLKANDPLIAHIHLNRNDIDHTTVCHECIHAAWSRVNRLGVKPDADRQEMVAYQATTLCEKIMHHLNHSTH